MQEVFNNHIFIETLATNMITRLYQTVKINPLTDAVTQRQIGGDELVSGWPSSTNWHKCELWHFNEQNSGRHGGLPGD